MHKLAKVTLENEMDLVLAHKRSMKLAEIAGLSLSAQTTFATAVSEISRNTIDHGKNGCLTLGISDHKDRSIIASIQDDNLHNPINKQGLEYAKRLVDRLNVLSEEAENRIELFYYVPYAENIDFRKLDEWRSVFRNEPPISPYDEIKRKNEQLLEMASRVQESEDHYRRLTDTLPLMMFSLDKDRQFVYTNKWLSDYLGYNLDELNDPEIITRIFQDDQPSFSIADLVKNGETIKAEVRVKEKISGNWLWHLLSIIPSKTDSQTPGLWFGFLVDIHSQKLLEQTLKDNHELKVVQAELQNNIRELNRSNTELQEFAFVASHDLQEPLRKIIFFSDYILHKYLDVVDEHGQKYLTSMHDASLRMRNLISDLLSFSQVNKKVLTIKEVDLNILMQQVKDDFEITIKEKNATISIGDLPVIEGDWTMLNRLFDNLLSNALKYVSDGVKPKISINAVQRNEMVEISITDNGIGFDEKLLSKMFTLFQRLHGRTKYDGTGLGLAICRKIVEMHYGFITAKSDSDSGSSFFIYLPLKQIIPEGLAIDF
jgi:PAS domain S-box-containing protein